VPLSAASDNVKEYPMQLPQLIRMSYTSNGGKCDESVVECGSCM
jgi:hypothetical protein